LKFARNSKVHEIKTTRRKFFTLNNRNKTKNIFIIKKMIMCFKSVNLIWNLLDIST